MTTTQSLVIGLAAGFVAGYVAARARWFIPRAVVRSAALTYAATAVAGLAWWGLGVSVNPEAAYRAIGVAAVCAAAAGVSVAVAGLPIPPAGQPRPPRGTLSKGPR